MKFFGFFFSDRESGIPDLVTQVVHVLRGFGHVVVENECRMGIITEQLGFLYSQGSDLGYDLFVIVLVVVIATVDVSLVDLFS